MRKIGNPLLCQLLMSKDPRHDFGAVHGRSRDLGAGKPREHAESFRLGGFRSTHHVQSTHSLAVKNKALGEGLRD